jgi:hypothetical protein
MALPARLKRGRRRSKTRPDLNQQPDLNNVGVSHAARNHGCLRAPAKGERARQEIANGMVRPLMLELPDLPGQGMESGDQQPDRGGQRPPGYGRDGVDGTASRRTIHRAATMATTNMMGVRPFSFRIAGRPRVSGRFQARSPALDPSWLAYDEPAAPLDRIPSQAT